MPHIYAIGDIHGRLDLLKILIETKIEFNPLEDKIIFLGDYIDRGPDAKGVIEYIINLKYKYNQDNEVIITLKGNHEMMFESLIFDIGLDNDNTEWITNGGIATLDSYGYKWDGSDVIDCIPNSHIKFIDSLKTHYIIDDYIFVHAGLTPGVKIEDHQFKKHGVNEDYLWIRNDFIESDFKWDKIVVFGHTIQKNKMPLFMHNKIGIDTGAFISDILTCVDVLSKKVYQTCTDILS